MAEVAQAGSTTGETADELNDEGGAASAQAYKPMEREGGFRRGRGGGRQAGSRMVAGHRRTRRRAESRVAASEEGGKRANTVGAVNTARGDTVFDGNLSNANGGRWTDSSRIFFHSQSIRINIRIRWAPPIRGGRGRGPGAGSALSSMTPNAQRQCYDTICTLEQPRQRGASETAGYPIPRLPPRPLRERRLAGEAIDGFTARRWPPSIQGSDASGPCEPKEGGGGLDRWRGCRACSRDEACTDHPTSGPAPREAI